MLSEVRCPICGERKTTKGKQAFRCCNGQYPVKPYLIAEHHTITTGIVDFVPDEINAENGLGSAENARFKKKSPKIIKTQPNVISDAKTIENKLKVEVIE